MDNRKHPRYPVRLSVRYASARFLLSDYTKSISKGGVAIDSERDLDIDTEFVFEMSSPDLGAPLEVQGRVVWTRPTQSGKFTVGIQYVFPDDARRRQLQHVIETILADHEWERQRKHPRVPVSLEVHGSRIWVMRDLSLGGAMLQAVSHDPLDVAPKQELLLEVRMEQFDMVTSAEVVWLAQPYQVHGEVVPGRFAFRFLRLDGDGQRVIDRIMRSEAVPAHVGLVFKLGKPETK